MRGILLSASMGFFLALLQIAVFPFVFSTRDFSFAIPCLVMFIMSSRFSRVLVCAITIGMILDSYTFIEPLFWSVRYLFLSAMAFFLFQRWLTNRSMYTAIALASFMTGADQVIGWFINVGYGSLLFGGMFWSTLLQALVWNAGWSVVGFLLSIMWRRYFSFFTGVRGSSSSYGSSSFF